MSKKYKLTLLMVFVLTGATFSQGNGVGTGNTNIQNMNFDIRSYFKTMPRADVYESLTGGTPWLRNYWSPAILTDPAGLNYWGAAIKVDLVADKILFFEKGEELQLVNPIQTMTIIDSLTRDSIKLVRPEYLKLADASLNGWLQIFEMGKATLLYDLNKTLIESKAYGSSTKEYSVNDNFIWIIVLNGETYRIKKLKDAETLLGQYNPSVKAFSYRQKGLGPQLIELVRAFNMP